jgi:hypothetical protein
MDLNVPSSIFPLSLQTMSLVATFILLAAVTIYCDTLRQIPGPVIARWTPLWLGYQARMGRRYLSISARDGPGRSDLGDTFAAGESHCLQHNAAGNGWAPTSAAVVACSAVVGKARGALFVTRIGLHAFRNFADGACHLFSS